MKRQIFMENIWDRCIKRTRSGRICKPPIAKWSGEKLLTTLQGELPARYITLHGRKSSILLSCSTSEKRKQMSLNHRKSIKFVKTSKRTECKSVDKSKSNSYQGVTTRSRKATSLHTEITPTQRTRVTPSQSRNKLQKILSTVDHMKPKSKYHVADDLDTSYEIDDELVRRCLSFDASPQCAKGESSQELRMRSRRFIAEKSESGKYNVRTPHKESIDTSKKDSSKLKCVTDSKTNIRPKIKDEIDDVKFSKERTKIKSVKNADLSLLSSEKKDESIDHTDYRKRLRSGKKHIYSIKTRSSKSKQTNHHVISEKRKRNSTGDKASVLPKKKIIQASSCISYSDLRCRAKVKEPCCAEVKHIKSLCGIENNLSGDRTKEKERYSLRKKILREKNCQGCLDLNSKQKSPELSNQKLKIKSEISDIENHSDNDTSCIEGKTIDKSCNVGYRCRIWSGRMQNSPVRSAKKNQDTPKLKAKSSSKQHVPKKQDIGTILNIGSEKKPGERTLKMKKLIAAKLEEFNKEHTDDLFEGKEVFNLQDVLNFENVLDEECELDLNFNTPKLTFHVISPPAPEIVQEVDSLANPSEFNCDRSDADAYLYRRQMMKKNKSINDEVYRKVSPQVGNLTTRMEDASRRLDKLLSNLPFTEKDEPCSDEEVMSDYMDEFHFSDSDE